MKRYALIATVITCLVSACNHVRPLPQTWSDTASREVRYSSKVDTLPTSSGQIYHKPGEFVTSISGHFTAGHTLDTISALLTADDDTVTEDHDETYCLQLTNGSVPTYDLHCCLPTLINEGDLNGDGLDEFTVFQEPNHGCTADVTTFTIKGGAFRPLFEPFLYPTYCMHLPTNRNRKLCL